MSHYLNWNVAFTNPRVTINGVVYDIQSNGTGVPLDGANLGGLLTSLTFNDATVSITVNPTSNQHYIKQVELQYAIYDETSEGLRVVPPIDLRKGAIGPESVISLPLISNNDKTVWKLEQSSRVRTGPVVTQGLYPSRSYSLRASIVATWDQNNIVFQNFPNYQNNGFDRATFGTGAVFS